jgi:hypothetical protein
MQIAFIRAQIGAIALHILAFGPDVCSVTTDVLPISGQIVMIAVTIRLSALLRITLVCVGSERRRVHLRSGVPARVGHWLARLLIVGGGREWFVRVRG